MQADFGGSEVTLKDAYIDWFPMAAEVGQSFVLTAGQTKWPFGYQVVQSSSVRETPERAQVIRRLFPGERDRGVVVTTPTDKALWAQVGLFNGTGTEKRTGDIIPNDNNNTKDWVGRVRWSPMSNLDLGASAYLGTTVGRINAAGGSAGSGFVDENGNGVRDEGEPAIIIPGSAAVSAIEANKTRFGGDLQFWPMDGLAIKGEYVAGKQFVSAAEPEKNVQGWYALATYNVLPKTQLVGMFDTYRDGTAANSNDIWHVGVNHYLTNALRARLFYQFIEEQIGAKKKNNIVQAELIALF